MHVARAVSAAALHRVLALLGARVAASPGVGLAIAPARAAAAAHDDVAAVDLEVLTSHRDLLGRSRGSAAPNGQGARARYQMEVRARPPGPRSRFSLPCRTHRSQFLGV